MPNKSSQSSPKNRFEIGKEFDKGRRKLEEDRQARLQKKERMELVEKWRSMDSSFSASPFRSISSSNSLYGTKSISNHGKGMKL